MRSSVTPSATNATGALPPVPTSILHDAAEQQAAEGPVYQVECDEKRDQGRE